MVLEASAAALNNEACEAIVFRVQDYHFALPLGAIVRIVSGRSLQVSTDAPIPLFDGEPLPIVDLGMALNPGVSSTAMLVDTHSAGRNNNPNFLLIVRLASQQCCGLVVDQLPQIQQLPLEQVYRLPEFYRHQLANLATHAIVLNSETEGASTVLFLLDLAAYLRPEEAM